MSTKLPKPTDAELLILQALWKLKSATVKQIHELSPPGTAYTTVLTFLQIMTEKGLVQRDDSQRAHVYQPTLTQEETQEQLLSGLAQRAFGGSISKLVMQALSNKRASAKELTEIRRLIEQLAKDKK